MISFISGNAKADLIYAPDDEGYIEEFQDTNQNGNPFDNLEVIQNLELTPEGSIQLAKQEELLPDDNTIVLYDFNEAGGSIINDKSRNQITGQITNPQWVDGKYNGGLLLDNYGYIDIGNNQVFDLTNELSIDAWIYPTSLNEYGPFVMKNQAYVLQFAPGTNGYLRGALYIDGAWRFIDDDTTPILTDTWTHVAFSYNGAVMALYVNGELVKIKSQSGLISTNSNSVFIGKNSIGNGYWYNGIIDEVRISNTALTQFNHFIQKEDIDSSNAVVAYNFNNNDATDSSMYENNGQISPLSDGEFNSAFVSSGKSYVEISSESTIPITDSMSAEAWVYPYSWDDYGPFVMRDKSFALQFAPGGNGFIRAAINQNNNWYCLDDDTYQLPLYEWTHVAMSYGNGLLCIYINNELVKNMSLSGTVYTIGNPIYIGKNPIGNGYWYNGKIDEVRVTNTPYTSFNILSEYSSESNQVILLHFNEYTGLQFTDDSYYQIVSNYFNVPHCYFDIRENNNACLYLNGIDEYVSIGKLRTYDSFILSAWINPQRTNEYEPIIMKDDNFVLQFARGGNYLRGGVFIDNQWWCIDDNSFIIYPDHWYQIAFMYDGTSMNLYVNDILIKSQQQSGSIIDNGNPVFIGRNPRYSQWWYKGYIDNIGIYINNDVNILNDHYQYIPNKGNDSRPHPLPDLYGLCEG